MNEEDVEQREDGALRRQVKVVDARKSHVKRHRLRGTRRVSWDTGRRETRDAFAARKAGARGRDAPTPGAARWPPRRTACVRLRRPRRAARGGARRWLGPQAHKAPAGSSHLLRAQVKQLGRHQAEQLRGRQLWPRAQLQAVAKQQHIHCSGKVQPAHATRQLRRIRATHATQTCCAMRRRKRSRRATRRYCSCGRCDIATGPKHRSRGRAPTARSGEAPPAPCITIGTRRPKNSTSFTRCFDGGAIASAKRKEQRTRRCSAPASARGAWRSRCLPRYGRAKRVRSAFAVSRRTGSRGRGTRRFGPPARTTHRAPSAVARLTRALSPLRTAWGAVRSPNTVATPPPGAVVLSTKRCSGGLAWAPISARRC